MKHLTVLLMTTALSCGNAPPNSETSTDIDASILVDGGDTGLATDSAPYVPQTCDGEVVFRDAALEAAVRETIDFAVLGKPLGSSYDGEITGELLARVQSMGSTADRGIETLEGIECFVNLEVLWLNANRIEDISLLSYLTRATDIHLTENKVSDLSPLSNLTALAKLYLSDNPIDDATPLSGLSNLDYVFIANTGVSNLDWVSGLNKLSLLDASGNGVSDISPLAGLQSLVNLNLTDNAVTDLSAFDGAVGAMLTYLFLANNDIVDIGPIANTNVLTLDVSGNAIVDISPLRDLIPPREPTNMSVEVCMRELRLNDNAIEDISVLSGLGEATTVVTLWGNKIEDLSPLVGTAYSRRFDTYDFSGNHISDLSPLAEFGDILFLDISDNAVRDLRPLSGKSIHVLQAAGNQIHDLSPLLSGMVFGGAELDLTNNPVASISPLAALARANPLNFLDYIFLLGCPLDDLALQELIPFLCELGTAELYFGDGETCSWNTSPTVPLPEYTYPPVPYDGEEPLKPEVCAAASGWLESGTVPGLSRQADAFSAESVEGDPVVQDMVTGLSWRRCSEGQTWQDDTCDGAATEATFGELGDRCAEAYAGYDDWRVPSASELQTLVGYDVGHPGPVVLESIFPGTYPGDYWAATEPPSLGVNFFNGTVGLILDASARVRCARGGGAPDAPVNRFEVADDIVTDTSTGLTWQRCAVGQVVDDGVCTGTGERMSFAEAQGACTGNLRLPTARELFGIVNGCAADPAAFTSAFSNTPPTSFWSDTPFIDIDPKMWTVDFAVGTSEPLAEDGLARVRCVGM